MEDDENKDEDNRRKERVRVRVTKGDDDNNVQQWIGMKNGIWLRYAKRKKREKLEGYFTEMVLDGATKQHARDTGTPQV